MNAQLAKYLIGQPWAVRPELLDVALNLINREGSIDPEAVQTAKAARLDGTFDAYTREGVAIVPVIGPIFRYADSFTLLCGGATVETIARDFRTAINDPSIRSILLNIDSPGGQANGIAELAAHIREGAQIKPVVAYIGGAGNSAAYWLASAASEIVIDSTAAAGSIGVVMGYPTPGDGKKSVEFVSSQSPNKRPNPTTEKGRATIQATVDDLAELFVDAVATYRGVSRETVLSDFGQGGYLIGSKAVDAGLADAIGSFEGTLARMIAGDYPTARKGQPQQQTKAKSTLRRSGPAPAASTSNSSTQAGAGSDASPSPSKGPNMPKSNWFKKLLGGGLSSLSVEDAPDFAALARMERLANGVETLDEADEADSSASLSGVAATLQARTFDVTKHPQYVALQERAAAAEASANTTATAAADTFTMDLVKANRILPASTEAAKALFVQLAADDRSAPLASGSRVASFKAFAEALPGHQLTTELSGTGKLPAGAKTLATDSNASAGLSPEREAELLGMTSLGEQLAKK